VQWPPAAVEPDLPATDEMHDLKTIPIAEYRCGPIGSSHYNAIQLDGYPRWRQLQLFNQLR